MYKYFVGSVLFLSFFFISCGAQPLEHESMGNTDISNTQVTLVKEKAKEVEQTANDRAENTEQTEAKGREVLHAAVANLDPSMCEEIGDTSSYKTCLSTVYNGKAVSELNIGYCERIPSEIQAGLCATAVVFEKAVTEENSELCESLGGEQEVEGCLQNYFYKNALSSLDVTSCDGIKSREVKATCQDDVRMAGLNSETAEPGYCLTVGNASKKSQCEDSLKALLSTDTEG